MLYDVGVGHVSAVVCRQPSASWQVCNVLSQRYDILCLAIQGKSYYTCGTHHFATSPGSLLFLPSGTKHSAFSDPVTPWGYYTVHFEKLAMSVEAEIAVNSIGPHLTINNHVQMLSWFRDLECLWGNKGPAFMLRVRGIILEIMHSLVSIHIHQSGRILHASKINNVLSILHECTGMLYSCDDLADMVELSPSRFRVLFRQMTGNTPMYYQNLIRMYRARDLLLRGGYTVTRTASEVGFDDVYYFSKLFKRIIGVTPSYYRNL